MAPAFVFRDPWWLLALAGAPLALWWRFRRPTPVWFVPSAAAWHHVAPTRRSGLSLAGVLAAWVLLTLALARPQRLEERREGKSQGYDIMLAIDLSTSMLAEDYAGPDGTPLNRLQALQPLIDAFVAQRPADRIGIVVFSGHAYTLSPLTFDHSWLGRQLRRVQPGIIEEGTAIGDGLAAALNRLDQAGRKVAGKRQGALVVLLTDGANNRGLLTPLEAAGVAKAQGVPVYTIAIGTDDGGNIPLINAAGKKAYHGPLTDRDEPTLWRMALLTDGKFFRGDSAHTVAQAFEAIGETRKIEFAVRRHLVGAELFSWFLWPGVLLLALIVIAMTLPAAWGEFWARRIEAGAVAARARGQEAVAVFRQQMRHFFI